MSNARVEEIREEYKKLLKEYKDIKRKQLSDKLAEYGFHEGDEVMCMCQAGRVPTKRKGVLEFYSISDDFGFWSEYSLYFRPYRKDGEISNSHYRVSENSYKDLEKVE